MPRRQASPAPSEHEVDILGSLYPGYGASDDEEVQGNQSNDLNLDFDGILHGPEDPEDDDEAFIALQQAASFRKASSLRGKTVKKGGGFQAMGLNAHILKAINRKGYSVPTPIQRKSIPLILSRKDVVGMARTGSGKTAAFVIPMIERLKTHSATVGARAVILSPSRELAIQTLKVVKEFGRGTNLKTVLLVGGDSLEEQFGAMAANPDVVIATPGRFLHLKVEMGLNLSTIEYVVFDEADRLFEMGFAAQLTEILHALPPSRQTLLFSATLPQSLVEFAQAGLQEPSLVRLDAETKVSPDLQSAFFTVKGSEKEGALLYLLQDVIKLPPTRPEDGFKEDLIEMTSAEAEPLKKRKRGSDNGGASPTEHSTIIFVATKHHVEYLASMLGQAGFVVSYVYGSLDQVARRSHVDDFRRGRTSILVVTDVAARGIDIPILANVINYDFPPQPKLFVHRVGRTARAGQRGWSYSLVRDIDAPYLIDLQLFLGRKLVLGQTKGKPSFGEDIIVGSLPRVAVEPNVEWVEKTIAESEDFASLRRVASKAESLYMRTRHSAAAQSAKRARDLVGTPAWTQQHVLFGECNDDEDKARADMLARISGFKPQETIFEIKAKGKNTNTYAADLMRRLRKKIRTRRQQPQGQDEEGNGDGEEADASSAIGPGAASDDASGDDEVDKSHDDSHNGGDGDSDGDSDREMEIIMSDPDHQTRDPASFKDSDVYMSYMPRNTNAAEERGYGVHSGTQGTVFIEAARKVAMDLTNDATAKNFGQPSRPKMRWDKKNSKYVSTANDEDGSKSARLIRGESGVKIAASFQSGRFDRWRRAHRVGRLPRAGEAEKPSLARLVASGPSAAGARYLHRREEAPKAADKFRDDYYVRKKRVEEAREKRVGRFRDGGGKKGEVRGLEDVRKARKEKERRKQKNARPSRK